eukprot:m.111358 g.111358  ORF g.111358 m.111358 type:complete len:57 (+) comp13443_c2_seq2:1329-1499(+)
MPTSTLNVHTSHSFCAFVLCFTNDSTAIILGWCVHGSTPYIVCQPALFLPLWLVGV